MKRMKYIGLDNAVQFRIKIKFLLNSSAYCLLGLKETVIFCFLTNLICKFDQRVLQKMKPHQTDKISKYENRYHKFKLIGEFDPMRSSQSNEFLDDHRMK